jgi:hypothetical protein
MCIKKAAIKINLRKYQTVTEVCYAFMVAAFVAAETVDFFMVAAFVAAGTAAILWSLLLLLLGLLPFCGRWFCCCLDCCYFIYYYTSNEIR